MQAEGVLAKLGRLSLLEEVLKGEVHVLRPVVEVVLVNKASPVEAKRLRDFIDRVKVVEEVETSRPSKSLSEADHASLAWALHSRADWLVADEHLLRRIAQEEGLSVIGCLGLLVAAAKQGVVSIGEARVAVDEAVDEHALRVSVKLYQRILLEIEKTAGNGPAR